MIIKSAPSEIDLDIPLLVLLIKVPVRLWSRAGNALARIKIPFDRAALAAPSELSGVATVVR